MAKWICKKCNKLNIKYLTLCQYCSLDRGFWNWFFDKRNFVAIVAMVLFANFIFSMINVIFLHSLAISMVVTLIALIGISLDLGFLMGKSNYFN